MNAIKIYTAITGAFEPDRNDIQVMGKYDRFVSPRMNAKIYKVMPHLFFNQEITIWLDGNIRFNSTTEISDFLEDFLGEADMAVFKHPYRDCAYQEAMACMHLDNPDIILNQVNQYRHDGFPDRYGLAECGVIVRRNIPRVNRFNEKWWAQICRFSSRDQISFPYSLWAGTGCKVKYNEGNVREDSRFIYTHRLSSKA